MSAEQIIGLALALFVGGILIGGLLALDLDRKRYKDMFKPFWFFVHNAIAHPLLCLSSRKASLFGRFHDWTAVKMGVPH